MRIAALSLALAPTVAFAHPGHEGASLADGFLHPLGGVDHIIAMVAVGLLAVRLGGRALWLVPASFVVTMALAGLAGMAGFALPYAETGIALSVVVLGVVAVFAAVSFGSALTHQSGTKASESTKREMSGSFSLLRGTTHIAW